MEPEGEKKHTMKTLWFMIQATGEPYKTEKCIKLIFSLMQKTTLTRGFWNAFLFLSPRPVAAHQFHRPHSSKRAFQPSK